MENIGLSDHALTHPEPRLRRRSKQPSKLIATMLSGSSEDLVIDAIESVLPWIDELLLIDTGITDSTVSRCQDAAGDKFALTTHAWNQDFSAARNAALKSAEQRGATWAMTLDTDERFNLTAFVDRNDLVGKLDSDLLIETWFVAASDDSYAKERFIRLPTELSWAGRTHEALLGATPAQRAELVGCRFSEVPKTIKQFEHKLHRDVIILNEVTTRHPLDSRWWHYLGQTHESLGQTQKAIDAFQHCAELDGWCEQSAWAAYCAAKCLAELRRFEEAEQIAAFGLTRDATFPELPWIAGWACFQAGEDRRAIAWSVMAASLGNFNGTKAAKDRVGFRFIPAWYESPFDTLRFAYRRIGETHAADMAETQYESAKSTRLQPVIIK